MLSDFLNNLTPDQCKVIAEKRYKSGRKLQILHAEHNGTSVFILKTIEKSGKEAFSSNPLITFGLRENGFTFSAGKITHFDTSNLNGMLKVVASGKINDVNLMSMN